MAGHEKYMKIYNRFDDGDLCALFTKAESTLQIFERIDEDLAKTTREQAQKIKELEANVTHLLDHMENIKEKL